MKFTKLTTLFLTGTLLAGWPVKPLKADSSVNVKIGQMIMVGFRGKSPSSKGVKSVLQQVSTGEVGGVLLMSHNVGSFKQVQRLTNAFRRAAAKGGQLPPLIAIDQEGGPVQRIKTTRFPSAAQVAKTSEKRAFQVYKRLACQLASAGVNLNFGPVVDLDIRGRANAVISRVGRSYGRDPKKVGRYANQFVAAHKMFGVMTTAKHFPGHGSSLSDSHRGFTAIPQWSQQELVPFQMLTRSYTKTPVDFVMVGHLYNKKWGAPASISHKAIVGQLRG